MTEVNTKAKQAIYFWALITRSVRLAPKLYPSIGSVPPVIPPSGMVTISMKLCTMGGAGQKLVSLRSAIMLESGVQCDNQHIIKGNIRNGVIPSTVIFLIILHS